MVFALLELLLIFLIFWLFFNLRFVALCAVLRILRAARFGARIGAEPLPSLAVVKAALADNHLEVRGSVGVALSVMRHLACFVSATTNGVRNMHLSCFSRSLFFLLHMLSSRGRPVEHRSRRVPNFHEYNHIFYTYGLVMAHSRRCLSRV